MNQNEIKNACKVTKVAKDSIDCPVCFSIFEIKKSVEFQLVCPTCLLRVTIYVDEGAARVFDKQRQVEKPVVAKDESILRKRPKLESMDKDVFKKLRERNASQKQESQRFEERTTKQKTSRTLGIQGLQKRRKSR